MKQLASWLFRLLGTAAAFWLLFSFVDVSSALEEARRSAPAALIAGLAFYALGQVFAAARWRHVLRARGLLVPLRETLRVNAIGVFASMFLPGVAGGDAVRPLLLRAPGQAPLARSTLYATVVFERMTGILATLLWSLFGLALLPASAINDWVRTAVLAVLVGLGAGLLVLLAAGPFISRLRFLPASFHGGASAFSDFFFTALKKPRMMLSTLAWSIAFQASMIVTYAAFLLGITNVERWSALLVGPPMAWLASMAPVSLNGIGVRESVLVFIWSELGIPNGPAGAAAILALAPMIVWAAIGAVVLFRERNQQ